VKKGKKKYIYFYRWKCYKCNDKCKCSECGKIRYNKNNTFVHEKDFEIIKNQNNLKDNLSFIKDIPQKENKEIMYFTNLDDNYQNFNYPFTFHFNCFICNKNYYNNNKDLLYFFNYNQFQKYLKNCFSGYNDIIIYNEKNFKKNAFIFNQINFNFQNHPNSITICKFCFMKHLNQENGLSFIFSKFTKNNIIINNNIDNIFNNFNTFTNNFSNNGNFYNHFPNFNHSFNHNFNHHNYFPIMNNLNNFNFNLGFNYNNFNDFQRIYYNQDHYNNNIDYNLIQFLKKKNGF
jgi:hypothetical protein